MRYWNQPRIGVCSMRDHFSRNPHAGCTTLFAGVTPYVHGMCVAHAHTASDDASQLQLVRIGCPKSYRAVVVNNRGWCGGIAIARQQKNGRRATPTRVKWVQAIRQDRSAIRIARVADVIASSPLGETGAGNDLFGHFPSGLLTTLAVKAPMHPEPHPAFQIILDGLLDVVFAFDASAD